VQVEAFAIRLRRRGDMEAADLGVRLCQTAARQVYACYWMVALPVILLCLSSFEIAAWLPTTALWLSKPWLDRSILFALSRAAFGVSTSPRDLWLAQRQVWWSQLLSTWTIRRLSPWRSFTQPVYQLEGLSLRERSKRVALIRSGKSGSAALMTSAFSYAEMVLMFALISLLFWLAPGDRPLDFQTLFSPEGERNWQFLFAVAYALVIAFLEPFYVGAGFGMYLNRRVELEAWDIEQEFRRAFAK
jgi:hypothetical protein